MQILQRKDRIRGWNMKAAYKIVLKFFSLNRKEGADISSSNMPVFLNRIWCPESGQRAREAPGRADFACGVSSQTP